MRKFSLVLFVVLLLSCSGCFLLRSSLAKKLDETEKQLNEAKQTIEKIIHFNDDAKLLKYRKLDTIWFIGSAVWNGGWTWVFDIFKIAILIALLTELKALAFIIRIITKVKLPFELPKWVTSLLWSIIVSNIAYLFTKECDWCYFMIIGVLSWIVANIGWYLIINSAGKKAVVPSVKYLYGKIKQL